MPDDHSKSVPPLPIPNRTVKRFYADDSAATSVKVGYRQVSYIKKPRRNVGFFSSANLPSQNASTVSRRADAIRHACVPLPSFHPFHSRRPVVEHRYRRAAGALHRGMPCILGKSAAIIRACMTETSESVAQSGTISVQVMPDDHSKSVPPLPIPNRTVKRFYADDSAATSVKVGHRQAIILENPRGDAGVFFRLSIGSVTWPCLNYAKFEQSGVGSTCALRHARVKPPGQLRRRSLPTGSSQDGRVPCCRTRTATCPARPAAAWTAASDASRPTERRCAY